MNTLRFPNGELERLRMALLEDAPNEAAALLLAERVETGNGCTLLVNESIRVPREFANAGPYRIDISSEFIARVLKRARLGDLTLLFAHTHPFATYARFSAQDDAGERSILPSVFGRAPRGPHGAVVLSPSDASARVYHAPEQSPVNLRIAEVGRTLRAWPVSDSTEEPAASFDRTVRAIGAAGLRRLQELRVAIVGLGGLGSLVAQQLAHLGVEEFLLIDPDEIEASNLNRVVGASSGSVGMSKVDVASSMIRNIRPTASVEAIRGDVRDERDARRLVGVDLVFCCTDSHGSRAVLNQLAYQFFVPVIDIGVRIDAKDGKITSVVGRVQQLAPGLPCLICESLLDSEQVRRDLLTDVERKRDPYIVGAQEAQPAVISINGVAASLAVTMFLSVTCGLPLATRHQIYLADRGTVRNVTSVPAPTCFVCSKEGAFGRGDRRQLPWRR